jgi:hypothetical protein
MHVSKSIIFQYRFIYSLFHYFKNGRLHPTDLPLVKTSLHLEFVMYFANLSNVPSFVLMLYI